MNKCGISTFSVIITVLLVTIAIVAVFYIKSINNKVIGKHTANDYNFSDKEESVFK